MNWYLIVFMIAQAGGFAIFIALTMAVLRLNRMAKRTDRLTRLFLRMILVMLAWAESSAFFWVAVAVTLSLYPELRDNSWYAGLTTTISCLIALGFPLVVWRYWNRMIDVE